MDYLLKPGLQNGWQRAMTRLQERLDRVDQRNAAATRLQRAAKALRANCPSRISRAHSRYRRKDDFALVSVRQLATLTARRRVVSISPPSRASAHTIGYRLKDLEARLDPARFVRIGRGTLRRLGSDRAASIRCPAASHLVALSTGKSCR